MAIQKYNPVLLKYSQSNTIILVCVCFAELFKLESDDESKISGILPENEFEVDLEFNGTIILSDAPEPRLNPVLRNIPEPRLNPVLRDTPEPRLNPVLRNAPEPTRGSVLNGIPKLFGFLNETSFETKIATFMPALARFRNKEPWYLTVVEDSLGVRLHPTFLPVSEDNVRKHYYQRELLCIPHSILYACSVD